MMNKNDKLKRAAAASLGVGMSAVMCALPVSAAADGAEGISKSETVYVNADASGNNTKVTVSEWLKGIESSDKVEDESILDDIKNVKGEETFTQKDSELKWKAKGEDIYYEGTTDKELPVSLKLTYYLDGKEMEPEELKGKSGHLEIQIDYANNEKRQVSVNGSEEEVYSPIVMVTGLVMPNETFSNVVIDNGKVVNDGNRSIVLGFAVPGLEDSLGLEEGEAAGAGLVIPDTLKISANVTDFSMSPTFTVGLTDVLDDLDTDEIDGLDSLQDSLDNLEDAALELVDGSRELSEGTDTLGGGYEEFDQGVQTLKSGIEALDEGALALSSGVEQYTEGADALHAGIEKYLGEDGELKVSVTEYVNGVNTLVAGAAEYTNGANALADGVMAYVKGEEQLAEGAKELVALSEGLEQVREAVSNLSAGVDGEGSSKEDILTAAKELSEGTSKLSDALSTDAVSGLLSQVDSMTETGNELVGAAQQMSEDLQEQIADPAQDMARSLEVIKGQLEAVNAQAAGLEQTCRSQVDMINQTVALNNEKIANAKNTAAASASSIESTVSALEQKAGELEGEGQSEAAAKIREAISALGNARTSADALSGLESLDTVAEPDFSQIDTGKLEELSGALSSDIEKLETAVSKLPTQLTQLKSGLDSISAVKDQLPQDDLQKLGSRVETLDQGMKGLSMALESLSGGLQKLDGSAQNLGEASQGIDSLLDGFGTLGSANDELLNGAARIKNAGPALINGFDTLTGGTSQLAGGLDTLSGQLTLGSQALSSNSGKLRRGAAALLQGTDQLGDGSLTLADGSAQVKSGIAQLQSGAGELAEGMAQFEEEGTSKLKEAAEEELQDIVDLLDALSSDECRYDNFAGKDDSMDGDVKFVIETEGIS